MIVLSDYNAVELDVPKTACSWRLRVMRNAHIRFTRRPHSIAVTPTGAKAYTFVRHPLAYLRSRYYFVGSVPFWTADDLPRSSFGEFVDSYLETSRGKISELFDRYTTSADYVARVEQLPNALADIWRFLGVPVTLDVLHQTPRANVSKGSVSHARLGPACYSRSQASAVVEAERELISRFYDAFGTSTLLEAIRKTARGETGTA